MPRSHYFSEQEQVSFPTIFSSKSYLLRIADEIVSAKGPWYNKEISPPPNTVDVIVGQDTRESLELTT